jgi:hypothetical protein
VESGAGRGGGGGGGVREGEEDGDDLLSKFPRGAPKRDLSARRGHASSGLYLDRRKQ